MTHEELEAGAKIIREALDEVDQYDDIQYSYIFNVKQTLLNGRPSHTFSTVRSCTAEALKIQQTPKAKRHPKRLENPTESVRQLDDSRQRSQLTPS